MINKKFLDTAIVPILVITAIVLGLAIYSKQRPETLSSKDADQADSSSNSDISNQSVSAYDKNLTADEKALFYSPSRDATKEQLDTFSDLVAINAIPGDTVVIKDCTASPIVLKIKYGS